MAILTSSGIVFAQKVRFGLQGGLGLPSIQSKAPLNRGGDYQMSVRFLAGALAEVELKKFSIQSGLFLTQKGNISVTQEALIANGKPTEYEVQHTINLTYLELPVNAVFYKPSKFGRLYFGGGPYAAMAVDGFAKDKTKRNNYVKTVEKQEVEFGEESSQLKRSDFGLNVLGGIRLKNQMDFGVGFSAGLVDLNNTDFKSYNRVASVKIGYFF